MIKAFNKATKKFSDYFTYIEKELDQPNKKIEENITYFNSQIILWEYDEEYQDEDYEELFNKRFGEHYLIYNFMSREIAMKKSSTLLSPLKFTYDSPIYHLHFILQFLIQAKTFTKSNEYNTIIIHDEMLNARVFILLSTLMMYVNNKHLNAMDLYNNIPSFNASFNKLKQQSDLEINAMRYINYINKIMHNPIIEVKKLYLKCLLINGAPAIDNKQNTLTSPYVTINENSYYSPIIRIKSNGKIIYCSYVKNKAIDQVLYSEDSFVKFDCNCVLFGDIVIDVLHKGEGKFRLLFSIQFHSFFVSESAIRFKREDIDGVNKDIRYPKEFMMDLMFDNKQEEILSTFHEESVQWKKLISEFIVKGEFKEGQENREKDKSKILLKNDENFNYNKRNDNNGDVINDNDNEDMSNSSTTTTVDQVQKLLDQMKKNDDGNDNYASNLIKAEYNNDNHKNSNNDDDDEDLEDYMKKLEDQA